jgi:hypothetical protein
LHFATAEPRALEPVSHELRVPVLDQEDLLKQGIDTATLIKGASEVDALGSCVANASTAALSFGLTPAELDGMLPPGSPRLSLSDAVADEEFAIWLYHCLTDSSGDSADEWPPSDVGSSGLTACRFLKHQGLIEGSRIAHGGINILSLLQAGPLIVGQPWFNAWMDPDRDGFIDGDGSPEQLQADIGSGVAGGHETCWYAIDSLGYDLAGGIDPEKTVIRFRNSWSSAWALNGDGRAHLSTFLALGSYCDYRQFTFRSAA